MAYDKQIKEFQKHLKLNRKNNIVVPLQDYLKPSYFSKEYTVANGGTKLVNLLSDLDQAAKDVSIRSDQDVKVILNYESIRDNRIPDWQKYEVVCYQNQAISMDGVIVKDLRIENSSGAAATVRVYASRFYGKTKVVNGV